MNIFKKKLYIIFINLLIVIFFIYILSKSIFIWLDIYTKHNNFVIVPDISNLDIKIAKHHLDNLGLYYEIDSYNYNPKFFPYKVLTFAPQAGDIVKPGRTIFIQVNKINTQNTKLPNILFQKKHFALRTLYSKHFIIKNITYLPYINNDIILKVIYNKKIINPGDIIPYKSELDLIISI